MANETFADHGIHVPDGTGANRRTTCPQCSASRSTYAHQREKCLSVNVDNGTFHCHNCGWSGKLRVDNISVIHRPPIKQQPTEPVVPEDKRLSKLAREWLASRGIPVALAASVGCWSERRRVEGGEQECLAIPYRIGGKEVNVKYRGLHTKAFTTVAGARQVFCGLDGVHITDATPYVVIVEGEIDMLSCLAAGAHNVISVPSGANSLTDQAMDSIRPLYDNQQARFIIAVDGDAPGQDLQQQLIRRLGPERCKVAAWPEGTKDANDVLLDEGEEALRQYLNNARDCPVAGILSDNDGSNEYWARYVGDYQRGYDMGWYGLRPLWTPHRRQLHIVTGAPGAGKSHLLAQGQVYLTKQYGLKHGVFSPEMGTWGDYKAELAIKHVGAPFDEGPTPRMSAAEAGTAEEWINQHWFGVELEEPTIEELLRLCKVLVFRHGIDTFTIDPWNDIDSEFGKEMTETQFIRKSLTKVRRLAKMLNIMFFIVAHPTKMMRLSPGTMNYPVVTPYDIEGSNSWYARADTIVSLWRDLDDATKPSVAHVLKVRHARNGRRGQAELRYDPVSTRFLDVGVKWEEELAP